MKRSRASNADTVSCASEAIAELDGTGFLDAELPDAWSDESESEGSIKYDQYSSRKIERETEGPGEILEDGISSPQNDDRPWEPATPSDTLIQEPLSRIIEDANGNERYIYPEVTTTYDSDDSESQQPMNTIGNIPLSYYDSYPHIGYTIDGERIARPAKGQALDALLNTIDIPQGWTGLTDPSTGLPLELDGEQLELLRRVTQDEVADDGYDLYPPMVEYFTSKIEVMPLSAAPEPKRRFVPSRHEAKRIVKIAKAIQDGRIKPYRHHEESQGNQVSAYYDIWSSEGVRNEKISNIPAPRLARPTHDESYNPPPEYLPTKHERDVWQEMEDEDKNKEYLPSRYDSLRRVPGYDRFVKERFERCLDLYLAPRMRRSRVRADAESLLPKLPSPEDLRPYPSFCAVTYQGHNGRIRCLTLDSSGQWLATGGDDGTVRIWELLTGRQVWSILLSREHAVNCIKWRLDKDLSILLAIADNCMFFLVPPLCGHDMFHKSHALLDAGFGYAAMDSTRSTLKTKPPQAVWARPTSVEHSSAISIQVTLKSAPRSVNWHRAGTYLVSIASTLSYHAIAIHNLSKHVTQLPFKRLKGLPQTADFHPTKPHLFVATQQSIRIYDLQLQTLIQTLKPGARYLSSISLHPGGNNLIAGSYDRRLLWHDLELNPKLPYKTLRYHSRAVRDVAIHQGGLPLFASCSDDGTLQIYHGRVVDDGMENVSIVPLKVLRGHEIKGSLGVLGLQWHPREAWCVSCGADGVARLWM